MTTQRVAVAAVCFSGLAMAQIVATTAATAQAAIEVATGALDGHSYSLIRTEHGTRWVDAELYCEGAGGTLATITSAAENELLASMLDSAIAAGFGCVGFSFGHVNTWIGLAEEPDSEGSWHWITGEPLIYTNWGPGEPNDSFPGEDLGMMFCPETGKRGQWNDARSIEPEAEGSRQFFCEFADACQFAPPGQPIQLQRTAGPPNVSEVVWESCGGTGTLTVDSSSVSSAVLTLNSQVVLDTSAFTHHGLHIVVPIALQEGENLLVVVLRGKPGTSLAISLSPE